MPPSVLIADDNEFVRVSVRDALTGFGCTVYEAGDGEQVVDMALEILPDVIVLDVTMPKLDGFEALRFLRQRSELDETYIIMLTSADTRTDMEIGAEEGANEYLVKPVESEALIAAVEAAAGGCR